MAKLGPRRQSQRGQALIEFALIVPVLFIIIFIVVDVALMLDRWVVINNAAREAARVGAVGASASQIQLRAIGTSQDLLSEPDAEIDIKWNDANANGHGDPGESVVVNVSYCYDLLSPIARIIPGRGDGCPRGSIKMRACSDMRLEQGVDGIATGGACP